MADGEIENTFRREWPRILAAVIRYTGSLELAEDAVQEAFVRALASRDRQLLINPAAWITTAAKRIAIDVVRRDATLRQKLPLLAADTPAGGRSGSSALDSPGGDDRLGLLFVACSPSLAPETRLALALRFVCGIATSEIADVMLISHAAMSARLTRAKRQLEREGIRLSAPDEPERAGRMDDVLGTVHLLYTVGHTAFEGEHVDQRPVTVTAIELARTLRRLEPDDREVAGLLALLLLTDARTTTRTDVLGHIAPLEEVDRARWDSDAISDGLDLAAFALPGGGRFALQAGISGLHSHAGDWASTDWASICALYDRLVERWPSPSVRLARIVARSFTVGSAAALLELDALEPELSGATARHGVAVRADLLRRLGRAADARAAYAKARSVERNIPLRDFFGRRIDELTGPTN